MFAGNFFELVASVAAKVKRPNAAATRAKYDDHSGQLDVTLWVWPFGAWLLNLKTILVDCFVTETQD